MKTETKVAFSHEEIAEAMRVLNRVLTPKERKLTGLKHVLVTRCEGKRMLRAHGLDLAATYTANEETPEGGSGAFLFPIDLMMRIIKTCSSKKDRVTLQDDGETVCATVHTGTMSIPHTAPALPVDEFPAWRAEELDAAADAAIPSEAFARALECAAPTTDSRLVLKGVCLGNETFEGYTNQGFIVGTDARMLYAYRAAKPFPWNGRIVFPRRRCVSFLPGGEWKVRACEIESKGLVLWRIAAVTKSGAEVCVEGTDVNHTYPTWPLVIPKDPNIFATLGTSCLSTLSEILPKLPCEATTGAPCVTLRVEDGHVTVRGAEVKRAFRAAVRVTKGGSIPFESAYAVQYFTRIGRYGLTSWYFGGTSRSTMTASGEREMIALACVRP